ncbi:RcnB family protein [Phenylobacterium sp. 20VBR1]|uniref:RcnB family protein n=1 Tax=Phenylobacterium glaciei TaxID=2803784 RepID=A0A941HWD3_9CAUL|nr:RcnB family protein [Phenylobacterium glaciei]MBR7620764.1 RcnB family protein [Phenylobacterium glaciei]
MKTVIKGALALVLLASTAGAALAQDDGGEHRRANSDDGGYNPAMRASSRNVPPSLRERAPEAQTPQQAPQPQPQDSQGGRRNDPNWQSRQPAQPGQPPSQPRWNNGQGQDNDHGQRHDDRHDRNDRNQGWTNGWNGSNGWNNNGSNGWNNNGSNGWNNNGSNGWNNNGRDWRSDRNQQHRPRFDRRYYGQNYSSQQRYRGYAYRPPSGFYIRSWGYGDQLPRSWWSNQYRLNDWWSYGLPIPPIGIEYVRVGEDVLLVDMFSGRVVQVIRDVFW